jgi:hypothetical protein
MNKDRKKIETKNTSRDSVGGGGSSDAEFPPPLSAQAFRLRLCE